MLTGVSLVESTQYFSSSLHGCAAPAKAIEPLCWETVVAAALCWHKLLPVKYLQSLVPLLPLLYFGKRFLIYHLCPTELNKSKLMIKVRQCSTSCGVDVSFCSTLQTLFSVGFFSYFFLCENKWCGFPLAMTPELSSRLRNQRWCWGLEGFVPFMVGSGYGHPSGMLTVCSFPLTLAPHLLSQLKNLLDSRMYK